MQVACPHTPSNKAEWGAFGFSITSLAPNWSRLAQSPRRVSRMLCMWTAVFFSAPMVMHSYSLGASCILLRFLFIYEQCCDGGVNVHMGHYSFCKCIIIHVYVWCFEFGLVANWKFQTVIAAQLPLPFMAGSSKIYCVLFYQKYINPIMYFLVHWEDSEEKWR